MARYTILDINWVFVIILAMIIISSILIYIAYQTYEIKVYLSKGLNEPVQEKEVTDEEEVNDERIGKEIQELRQKISALEKICSEQRVKEGIGKTEVSDMLISLIQNEYRKNICCAKVNVNKNQHQTQKELLSFKMDSNGDLTVVYYPKEKRYYVYIASGRKYDAESVRELQNIFVFKEECNGFAKSCEPAVMSKQAEGYRIEKKGEVELEDKFRL